MILIGPTVNTSGHALSTTSPYYPRRCPKESRCTFQQRFMFLDWATHVVCTFLRHELHLKPVQRLATEHKHACQYTAACSLSTFAPMSVNVFSFTQGNFKPLFPQKRPRRACQNIHVSRISLLLDCVTSSLPAASPVTICSDKSCHFYHFWLVRTHLCLSQ